MVKIKYNYVKKCFRKFRKHFKRHKYFIDNSKLNYFTILLPLTI